jgi:hypothetical protein
MTLQPHPPHLPDTAPHWALGEAVIHRVDEVILPPETGSWLLPSATPEVVARAPWLQPSFADPSGTLHLAVHTFAVLINGLRILVDAGVGNGKSRSNPAWDHLDTPYLDRLVAAGFPPDSVDLVILTHLHTDHVGWNTRRTEDGAWRPTFPHARYLTARAEYDYWSGVEMDDWSGVEMDDARRQMFADSVRPVHDSVNRTSSTCPPTARTSLPASGSCPHPATLLVRSRSC